MNSFLTPEALIRQRLRRTAEVLVDDSSLRGGLSDAQAQELLDWGIAQVHETAKATNHLSDDEAYPLLEEQVAIVRRVMRLFSRLMSAPGTTSRSDTTDYSNRLLNSLEQLAGRANHAEQLARAAILEHNQAQLDEDSKFRLLMTIVQVDIGGSLDEEA